MIVQAKVRSHHPRVDGRRRGWCINEREGKIGGGGSAI